MPTLSSCTSVQLVDPAIVLSGQSSNLVLLVPQITTTERDAITSPAPDLIIYNTTLSIFQRYIDGAWSAVSLVSLTSSTTLNYAFRGSPFSVYIRS